MRHYGRCQSYILPLFQSELEISFIRMQILVYLHVNKTNFHMKGFTPGLALKQTQKATRKSPIAMSGISVQHRMSSYKLALTLDIHIHVVF